MTQRNRLKSQYDHLIQLAHKGHSALEMSDATGLPLSHVQRITTLPLFLHRVAQLQRT